jgi:hypothetical protein
MIDWIRIGLAIIMLLVIVWLCVGAKNVSDKLKAHNQERIDRIERQEKELERQCRLAFPLSDKC